MSSAWIPQAAQYPTFAPRRTCWEGRGVAQGAGAGAGPHIGHPSVTCQATELAQGWPHSKAGTGPRLKQASS